MYNLDLIDRVIQKVNSGASEEERGVIGSIVNGGKSDPTNKAADICAYMGSSEEIKNQIYKILTEHWQ